MLIAHAALLRERWCHAYAADIFSMPLMIRLRWCCRLCRCQRYCHACRHIMPPRHCCFRRHFDFHYTRLRLISPSLLRRASSIRYAPLSMLSPPPMPLMMMIIFRCCFRRFLRYFHWCLLIFAFAMPFSHAFRLALALLPRFSLLLYFAVSRLMPFRHYASPLFRHAFSSLVDIFFIIFLPLYTPATMAFHYDYFAEHTPFDMRLIRHDAIIIDIDGFLSFRQLSFADAAIAFVISLFSLISRLIISHFFAAEYFAFLLHYRLRFFLSPFSMPLRWFLFITIQPLFSAITLFSILSPLILLLRWYACDAWFFAFITICLLMPMSPPCPRVCYTMPRLCWPYATRRDADMFFAAVLITRDWCCWCHAILLLCLLFYAVFRWVFAAAFSPLRHAFSDYFSLCFCFDVCHLLRRRHFRCFFHFFFFFRCWYYYILISPLSSITDTLHFLSLR